MLVRWIAALAALAGLLLAAGCGGGADATKAQVRLVNASSGYAKLDLRVDGQLRQGDVGYGATDSYVEVDPDKSATVLATGGSSAALLSFTPAVAKKKHYTVLAYGSSGALRQVVLDEDAAASDTNRALLRVVNAAPDAGALDVYLSGSDEALASLTPKQAGAAVGAVAAATTVDSGTWRLRVTAAGNRADLRLDVPALVLSSKQVATLVLTAPAGGGGALVGALLLTQQGSVLSQNGNQARVRIAVGLAGGATVGVQLGSTTLLPDTTAPTVGNYALVPAGAQTLKLRVNGSALADDSKTLVAGADYTLLIFGTAAAPANAWLGDDNTVPTDATQARLRLVNGVAPPGTPLSLTIDLLAVGGTVAAGQASVPALVPANPSADLAVSAAGLGVVFTTVDQPIVAGASYSLFVLGAPGSVVGTLRKDR